MIKNVLVVLLLLSVYSIGDSAIDAYSKAQEYEKNGDITKAMLFYKLAARLSLHTQKTDVNTSKTAKSDPPILKFGANSISGYGNDHTDSTIKQIILSTFDVRAYNMNYILPITHDFVGHQGRKKFETKFQISFKKSLAKNLLGLNDELFLGYTQTSWWQTSAKSAPFRETNYAPEFFMMIPNTDEQSVLKAYKIGLLHQSNGQGGLLSRSWNRAYLSGIFQANGVFIIPRAWYRFPERKKADIYDANGDDNPDIYNYLGYGDLTIAYPYNQNFFTLLVRNNLRFRGNNHGAVQFDWTFPLKGVKDMFGYIQVFSGYGESLIDYNKRNNRIGIGFAITR